MGPTQACYKENIQTGHMLILTMLIARLSR